MKKQDVNHIQKVILLGLLLFGIQAFAVNPGLTYHGRLMTPDGVPVASSVQFKIQIRSAGPENCLLWEETQTQDLSSSAGNFSVGINDGTGIRTDGGTNTFTQIFANNKVITVAAGKCASGTTYTPSLNDARKMVVSFNDGSGWEDASAQTIAYVPKAIDALQVAGFPATSLLRFAESDGTLVGTTPLNNAQYTALTALISGNSNLYLKNSSTAGTAIPQVSGTPATLTAGSMWFDTSSGALKFYDGSSAQTVGASSGTVSSIATGAALTGGPITTTGTIDMATLGAAGTGTKISYDKYGRVTGTTTLAEADIPTLSTAGKVSGSAINSGTISGTAGMYTSGDVTATNVSSTHAKTRDAQFFDSATNAVTVKSPSILTGSYTLTLPTSLGSAGNVLATDASGNLSWIAPTTGSVVSVSGTPPIISSGGATPTISITKSDATHDGYLSSSDWSTFSSKLGSTLNSAQIWVGSSTNTPASVNLSGDASLSNTGGLTVTGLRGKAISATAPTAAGQVLRYDGTNTYAPAYLSLADIRSSVTPANTAFPATSCTSSETLTWSSLTDSLTCTTITISGSAITFPAESASKVLAAPSATTGTPIFRTLVESDLPSISTAGKVSGNAITSGTLSGTTAINTSGDVTAVNISSTHAKTRDVQYFDSTTNTVIVKAPNTVTSYTLTLPPAVGADGNVLATDSSGNLSWIAPTTGSVVSVSGTPPIVSSGGATPTISIAKSDASHDGYLSSGDWSTFNSKLGSTLNSAQIWVGNVSNVPAAVTLSGDVSLSYAGVVSVIGLRGKTIGTTTPTTAGQVLRYDGTNTYVPTFLSLADVRSAVIPGNTMFPATPCTAAQTLTWSSLTDTMSCTTIAITDSAVTYASQTANKVLASPSTGSGTPAFRTLTVSDLPTVDVPHGGTGTTTLAANKVVVANGTGTALTNFSCTSSQIFGFDASGYPTCTDFSSSGGFINGGNAFGANANLGTKDNYDLNFMTATTTRMTISSAGNIGIGTTTPHEGLEVAGSVRVSTAPSISTTLTTGATAADTAFAVASTTGYPYNGVLKVESEYVTYASSDATHFYGLGRGANGTAAATHASGKSTSVALLTAGAQAGATPTFILLNDGSFAVGGSSAIGAPSLYGNYAIGNHAVASGGSGAYAIGAYASASGNSSLALGYQAQTTGKWATAIGYVASAGSYTETVVGESNLPIGLESAGTRALNAPIFVVGNGVAGSVYQNALAQFRNGQLIVNPGTATTSTSPTISSLMNSAILTAVGTTTDSTAGSLNAASSAGTSLLYVRNDGNVGIGTTSPGYKLSVAGDVNVTGNFRVNGTILSASGGSTLSGITNISNGSGDITLAPATGTGAVQINSGTASTSSTTGALVVAGGIGVSGGINTGAAIVASGDITALGNLYTTGPLYASQHYGTTTASGTVKIDGTSSSTKGFVLLNSAGGSVGIGTTSPASQLNVASDTSSTAVFIDAFANGSSLSPQISMRAARGSQASPSAVVTDDVLGFTGARGYSSSGWPTASSAGMYIKAGQGFTSSAQGGYLTFETTPNGSAANGGRVERVRIDPSGQMAIGTTTPSSILHTVASGAKTASYIGNELSNIATSSTGSVSKIGLDVQSTGTWNGSSATNTGLNVNVSGGTTNYAATFQGGFVGVGTTTPLAPLHLQRDGIGTTTADGLYLGNTTPGVLNSGQSSPALHWATNAWDSSTGTSRSIEMKMEIPANSNINAGNNVFSIAENIGGGGWTNILTINRYGNVANTLNFTSGGLGSYGIVSANGGYSISASSTDGLVTQPPGSVTAGSPLAYAPRVKLRGYAWDTGAAAAKTWDWYMENAPVSGNPTTSSLSFYGAMGGAGTTTPLTMLANGNVGIGSTTPGYKLDVAGDVNASGCLRSSAGVASGSCVSDQILKTEIQTFDLGLEALLGVTPKTFKYNGLGGHPESDRPELGLIAQDLEKTAPSLVGKTLVKLHPEDSHLTEVKQVNYTAIPYVVINAVKELYQKFMGVDREVASLKEENKKLKEEVSDLNTRLEKIEKTMEKNNERH